MIILSSTKRNDSFLRKRTTSFYVERMYPGNAEGFSLGLDRQNLPYDFITSLFIYLLPTSLVKSNLNEVVHMFSDRRVRETDMNLFIHWIVIVFFCCVNSRLVAIVLYHKRISNKRLNK